MILIAVLLPILAGVLLPLAKIPNRRVKLAALLVTLAASAGACTVLALDTDKVFHIIRMTAGLSLDLMTDDLARLFIILTSYGWLLVGVYACVYMTHEHNEDRFFAFMLVSEGLMLTVCLSANLTTLYTAYLLLTLASMPLVIHSMDADSVKAAFKYLFYSIGGALLALLGMFFLYKCTATLDFVPGGTLDPAAADSGLFLTMVFITLLGFSAKAAIYPLHGWLPAAFTIPAPASALLSGLVAKSGVIAVIRVIYYMTGAEYLRGTWAQTALLVLALVTVFMGSMMAYREKVMKRRLAWSTVSQLSYILVGLFILTPTGVQGALLHTVFHMLSKICLYMAAGAIIFLTHKTRVDELGPIGRQIPKTMICFTLASLTLIGIPPTGGFTSKWYLATAALEGMEGAFGWVIPVVLLLSALLTAGYLLPISVAGFFPDRDAEQPERIAEPTLMWVPMLIFAVLAVALGLFSGGLVGFTGKIAGLLS